MKQEFNLKIFILQIKKIVQTLGDQLLTLATTIKKGFIYFLLAILCSCAFFVHEFFPVHSTEFVNIVNIHSKSKDIRKDARNKVLELDVLKETEEFNLYLRSKKETDLLWDQVLDLKSEENFAGFRSFQQFLGEFGWAIGLLIYSIFNLSVSLFRNKKSVVGEVSLHSCLTFIAIFFISWALQQSSPDYDKSHYVVYSIVITTIIVLSTYYLLKRKINYIDHLKNSIRWFYKFMYKDAIEKDLIKPDKSISYRKIRMELTDKIEGNE